MSKNRTSISATTTLQQTRDYSLIVNSKKRITSTATTTQNIPLSSLLKKRINASNNKSNRDTTSASIITISSMSKHNDDDTISAEELKKLSDDYYVRVTTDGLKHMDYICHLDDENINNNCLERQLRPISGLRNRVKYNNGVDTYEKLYKETDFLQRICKLTTLKRLDLSNNELYQYPIELCDLYNLESLNLSNNKLSELEFPIELEKYHNLVEIILDSNSLTNLPKSVSKFKKLMRLSIRNNSINNFINLENSLKLRYLVADNNLINKVDETLIKLDKLELLHLKNNCITFIHSNFFKSNLNHLKQLDLSYNKIQIIPSEIFMLPHLDILNLSNNLVSKLPILPVTFKRTAQIFSIDLSFNLLTKFYDYLIFLTNFLDLSSNKIKSLPNIGIKKLTMEQLRTKTLKLEDNPLDYPPKEICTGGLRVIKQFFEEIASHIQVNHGFKLIFIGDSCSGKTSLAYALEDFNSQSNLIEQLNSKFEDNNPAEIESLDSQKLSKLIEVHEFFYKMETEKNQKSSKDSEKDLSAIFNNLDELTVTLNTMPMSIYDINGSIEQFGHLINLFIDRSALIVLCIDLTKFDEAKNNEIDKAEENLNKWLDFIMFKMSKCNSYYILPVGTKCDFYNFEEEKGSKQKIQNKTKLNSITTTILNKINKYFERRLDYVKSELHKIETLSKISPSQSDKLKHLANLFMYSKPGIHDQCPVVSSNTMQGIHSLNELIKNIVCNKGDYFPNVNKRIPTLWLEIEKYVFQRLGNIPRTRFADDSLRLSIHSIVSISQLCMDFSEFKERITEKYGIEHMIFDITNYLNAQGKILWLQDTDAY